MIYTVDQYNKELDRRLREIKKANIVFLAASGVHPDYINRIFEKGLNANNAPHGNYSTKPLYVNTRKNSPVQLSPKGKTGKSTFETGQSHKSTYFAKGYKQFKQQIGRGSKVNFRLFDDLKLDITNGLKKVKDKALVVVKRNINLEKLDNLTDKYGLVSFRFSKKEREKYLDILGKRLNKIMNNA